MDESRVFLKGSAGKDRIFCDLGCCAFRLSNFLARVNAGLLLARSWLHRHISQDYHIILPDLPPLSMFRLGYFRLSLKTRQASCELSMHDCLFMSDPLAHTFCVTSYLPSIAFSKMKVSSLLRISRAGRLLDIFSKSKSKHGPAGRAAIAGRRTSLSSVSRTRIDMSKASTSSLQHLLRQLYHAKNSLASAAAAEALSISGSSSGGGGSISSSTPAAAYSTAARSLHVLPAAGDASPSTSSIHHQHHTPSSTGEWATSSSTSQASGSSNSSSSSSGSSSNHNSNTAKTRNATPHHCHRHNASNHHHHPPHVAAASNNLLQSSFWIQPPSSGTTPPLPPFTSNSSPSSSSSSSAGHAVTPATTSSSSASSSLSATSTASQPADASYPAPFTPNPTSTDASTSSDANAQHQQEQQSNSQISTSSHHLTLHPGAYGIPKRLSASPRNTTPPASSAKGKGKEVDMDESLQAQLEQLQQSLLSVQVGEVSCISFVPYLHRMTGILTLFDVMVSCRTHTL